MNGIKHRHKTTERFKDEILYNCKVFNNLSLVAKRNRVSDGFVAKICYTRMELELRKSKYTPWGSTIGIDMPFEKILTEENLSFPLLILEESVFVSLLPLKHQEDMYEAIKHIPEKENVRYCVMDLSENFRSFVRGYFPNVNIVAEVYAFKEIIYGFYRNKGYHQARIILIQITDDMPRSKIKEIQTLRRTILKWFKEILAYYKTGLTNARP